MFEDSGTRDDGGSRLPARLEELAARVGVSSSRLDDLQPDPLRLRPVVRRVGRHERCAVSAGRQLLVADPPGELLPVRSGKGLLSEGADPREARAGLLPGVRLRLLHAFPADLAAGALALEREDDARGL